MARQGPQLSIIGRGHIGETRPDCLVVWPTQGIVTSHAGEIQVVADEHQVAGLVVGVQPAGGIGDDDRADAQRRHHADRQRDPVHRIALVEVGSSLQHEDGLSFQRADDQTTGMTGHCRHRPIGNVGRGDDVRVVYRIGQRI